MKAAKGSAILAVSYIAISPVACRACDGQVESQPASTPALPHVYREEHDSGAARPAATAGDQLPGSYSDIKTSVAGLGLLADDQIGDPALVNRRFAVEVDDQLSLHALRLPPVPENPWYAPSQTLEYTKVRAGEVGPASWTAIAEVYAAKSPQLTIDRNVVVASVVGSNIVLSPAEQMAGPPILLTIIGAKHDASPVVPMKSCVSRSSSSPRISMVDAANVAIVSHEYANPIYHVESRGLRVSLCDLSSLRASVEYGVSGTAYHRSELPDFAAYAISNELLHIVYTGVRAEAPSRLRLWHVAMNLRTATSVAMSLADGMSRPYMLRIFVGHDGRLYAFELFGNEDDESDDLRLLARVIPLGAPGAERGPSQRFFVDPWLQVHSLTFDGREHHHYGPTRRPGGRAK